MVWSKSNTSLLDLNPGLLEDWENDGEWGTELVNGKKLFTESFGTEFKALSFLTCFGLLQTKLSVLKMASRLGEKVWEEGLVGSDTPTLLKDTPGFGLLDDP